ncbi:MAG: hypothetical protein GY716_24115 [bacterium]|nr:hypothetical protein [bacterium]
MNHAGFRFALPIVLLLSAGGRPASAQETLTGEIERSGWAQVKIAIPDAESRDAAAEAREIVETLRSDLDFSGYFDVIDRGLYGLVPLSSDGEVRHDDWLSIGAEAMIQLRVGLRGGRVDLQAWLHDNEGKQVLFAHRYGGRPGLVRRIAHNLADDLLEHYTGRKGVAMTRIAFTSRHGEGKEIFLMDYDGRNIRRLTTTGTINLSPVWSPPDGDELAFVSWRGRQPGVYVMSSEGELGHLDTVGGELSGSPDWAPRGDRLVYSSDVHGNTELYELDRRSGRNTRLTRNPAIDTAPAVSPNGREIAFTSDRSGAPQIYLMDAEGLNVRRISWGGNYNESAAWHPDGGRIAYVSRIRGRFDVIVLDLETDETQRLTRGEGNNENPAWSRDGRHIVFASNRRGSYDIYSMRSDGSNVRRLTRGGDCFTPHWSP